MNDWRMLAESFPDGRQSFPAFVRQTAGGAGDPALTDAVGPDAVAGRRFVTTLQYLRASEGEFATNAVVGA